MKIPARTSIALIAAIAVLLVAGVAGATASGSSNDDATVSSDADGNPPSWDDTDAVSPVEPQPGMADVRARRFDRSIVNDDGTVTIWFTSGVEPCAVLDHVDVAYDDDAVTITLFEGRDPSAGDVACIEIALSKSVTITLDEPSNGRPIVDGAR